MTIIYQNIMLYKINILIETFNLKKKKMFNLIVYICKCDNLQSNNQ